MKTLLCMFIFAMSSMLAFAASDPQPKCDGCPPPLCYPGTQCCFVMPRPGEPPQNKPCCYLCEAGQTKFTITKPLTDVQIARAIKMLKVKDEKQ